MNYVLRILRRPSREAQPFWQEIPFATENPGETVASALLALNATPDLRDTKGNPVTPIAWEHSCLQKRCGACAMVVNGYPRLACDAFLKDMKARVTLEPLRKFPVVQDLQVDRSVLYENLAQARTWLTERATADADKEDILFDALRCLQCGCCLEVCPNFYAGGQFAGMATALPLTWKVLEQRGDAQADGAAAYRQFVFNGCAKSGACRDVCPAGIDTDAMLIHSNAVAVWKRKP